VGIHYQGECLYLNVSSVRHVGPDKYGKLKHGPLASASSLGVRAVHGYLSLSIVQNYVLYAGSLYLLILESRVEWTGEVPTSERFSLGNPFHEKTGESSRFFISFLWSRLRAEPTMSPSFHPHSLLSGDDVRGGSIFEQIAHHAGAETSIKR